MVYEIFVKSDIGFCYFVIAAVKNDRHCQGVVAKDVSENSIAKSDIVLTITLRRKSIAVIDPGKANRRKLGIPQSQSIGG